jgi:hypothetical protein
MFGGNDATDKTLLKLVTQRLARGTAAQARITATVQSGTVSLTGSLKYDAQRTPILKEIARIAGVRRVVDQLKVLPKTVYPTGPMLTATVAESDSIAEPATPAVPIEPPTATTP